MDAPLTYTSWQLNMDDQKYKAKDMSVSDCEIQVSVARLDFGGSLEAFIVDLFSGAIELFVETSLDEIICKLTVDGIEDAVNPLIGDFNENISQPILDSRPNQPPLVPLPSPYIQWPSQSWLKVADFFIDILGECLPINDMIDIIVGEGGTVSVPINMTTNVTVAPYANLDLGLDFVNVTGLNTFSHVDVLEFNAATPHTLLGQIDLDTFGLAVGANIHLTPLEQVSSASLVFALQVRLPPPL